MTTTTRRKFLVRSLQGATALLLPGLVACRASGAVAPQPAGAGVRRGAFGIQVYAVNQPFLDDPAGTLRRLGEIGYTEVECYADGKVPAADLRRMLDDAGLACPSVHLDFDPANLEAAFEHAHALGAAYAASSSLRSAIDPQVPWQAALTADEARRTAELANRIGEAAKQAGLQYAYHNHDYEFTDMGDGTSAYDFLLRETDAGLVKFEIDCGWMVFAGRDPAQYLERHPGRFPMLHIKDYLASAAPAPSAGGRPEMAGAELGRGSVDYRPIFAAARQAGVKHYFAEQEGPFARMGQLEAAAVAYEFLRSMQ